MFNRSDHSGSNIGGMSDKTNTINNSSFQRHQASNNAYRNFASGSALVRGSTGLISGSSQTAQHQQNSSSLVAQAQTHALAQQQRQLLQMTKNELQVQQMASNIQESLLIKRRLESIQNMQQHEANKMRTELQMKAASGMRGRKSPGIGSLSREMKQSTTRYTPVPSNSNSSVIPTKIREDEMTKPDLSTLAETAVAVASAATATDTRSRISGGILGRGSVTKMNSRKKTGNNGIAALLGRQASSLASCKEGLASTESSPSLSMPTSITSLMSNNAMADALHRDINATREKLLLEHKYKRSLDEMTKSSTTTAPSSSSWLLKSAGLGNSTSISMGQLRAQHEQLQQRRNSLPALSSSVSSELASLRSQKRRRLLDQKTSEIERLEYQDAMKQMRQLDAKMNMQLNSNSSLLAEMASNIAFQERRASIASSIASVGTSITTPNITTDSPLSSPVNRRNVIIPEINFDERSKILNKLSSLGGGFPMPKFQNELSNTALGANTISGGMKNEIPAEITPELGRSVVDIMRQEISSLSMKQELENNQQSRYSNRIGGFPMPPLYRHNGENHVSKSVQGQFNGAVSNNNAISSHIRKNVNNSGTKASRPPTLESYKRLWRDIRVVAGDDPRVDERLRKEVFARKLERGQIFVGKTGNSIMNNINNRNANNYVHQRRPSEMSHGSVSNNANNSERTKRGAPTDDSIVI